MRALALACLLIAGTAHAQALRLAATIAPVAQLARTLWPKAQVACLAPAADPHAVQLAPRAALVARKAQALLAAGVLDARWRPAHPHTLVLFANAVHGWLDPKALEQLDETLPAQAAAAGLPPPQPIGPLVRNELSRWRKLIAAHAPVGAIYAHGAWTPWLAQAGVRTLAVLEAAPELGTSARALAAALVHARAFAGKVLLITPAEHATGVLRALKARLGARAVRVMLPALGTCKETWPARMQRAYQALARALAR